MNQFENDPVVGRYPTSLLLDILSDGMDYAARGFWAQINQYRWYWWYVCDKDGEPEYPQIPSPDLTPHTVLIEMRDDEDGQAEKENRPFVGITLQKLADALDWALETHNHLFSSYSVTGKVIYDLDYDAIGADVVIQKIVLGEVVYG